MMTPLGDVASISTAYPFRKKVDSEEGGDVAVIQMRDVDDNAEGTPGAGATMVRNDGGRYDRHFVREGDLLFQSRGSRHPVLVVRGRVRAIAGSGLHVIRTTSDTVLSDYLAWWLNHPVSQGRLVKDVARGTYIPFVSKADLKTFLVPLPPVEVQKQIVVVDRLRRRERRLRERLDALTRQLVDGATFAAAVRNNSRE
jgi:hypothetical protein